MPEAEQEDEQEMRTKEKAAEETVEGEIEGQHISEFPVLAPSFKPVGKEDTLFIGEMQLTEGSSVKDLKEVAKYLKLTTSGSKAKIFSHQGFL